MTIKMNLFICPSFPIIKPDIINLFNESSGSNLNFMCFRKTFLSFKYFQMLYDSNFLGNFYLIKKAFENYLSIIKITFNKTTSSNKQNNEEIITSYADEILLLEYIDFLKLNLFYSDHFTMKFINSELIDYLDQILILLSNKEFEKDIYKRISTNLSDIYILVCLSLFEKTFINSRIKKFSLGLNTLNLKQNKSTQKKLIEIKIIKILFYFKSLREPFFEDELKLFFFIFNPDNKKDILVLLKIINDSTIENLSAFYLSVNLEANSLNNNLQLERIVKSLELETSGLLKKLNMLTLKLRLKIKFAKYCEKNKILNPIFLIEQDADLINFTVFFSRIESRFIYLLNSFLIDKSHVIVSNSEMNQINTIIIYFNTIIKMQCLINKIPKCSNYKKIFDEVEFLARIEKINFLLFDLVRKIKYQFSNFDDSKGNNDKLKSISDESNKSQNIKDNDLEIKDSKIRFLVHFETILDYFLNYFKLKVSQIEKFQSKNKLDYDALTKTRLFQFISEIPNYINCFSECKYLKFTKYFEKILYLKFVYFQNISKKDIKENVPLIFYENKIKNHEKVFERISDNLKVFLNSNEDLRKSMQAKKIFDICENLNKEIIYFNEFNKLNKSKYFPIAENSINKNFMIQIFTNPKLESELKLNFLFTFIVIFYRTNITFDNSSNDKSRRKISKSYSINHFNILLKTIVNFSDKVYKNIAELLFDVFIKYFIFNKAFVDLISNINENELNEFSFLIFNDRIKNSYNNEIDFENFYLKFDTFYNDEAEELNLFYKFIIILMIYFNSNDYLSSIANRNNKQTMNNYNNSISAKTQLKDDKEIYSIENIAKLGYQDNRVMNLNNLCNIIYSKFYLLLEYSFYNNLKFIFDLSISANHSKLVSYLTNNLSFSNYDFYESIIMEFVKYFNFDKIKLENRGDYLNNKDLNTNSFKTFDFTLHSDKYSLKKNDYFEKNLLFDLVVQLLLKFNIIELEKNEKINESDYKCFFVLNCSYDLIIDNLDKNTFSEKIILIDSEICKSDGTINKYFQKILKIKIYNYFTNDRKK